MSRVLTSRFAGESRLELERVHADWRFGTAAAIGIASAAVVAGMTHSMPRLLQALLIVVTLGLAGAFAWRQWRAGRIDPVRAAVIAAWAGLAVVAIVSTGLGEGLYAAALGFLSLIICSLGVLAGPRASIQASLVSTALVGLLTAAAGAGWLPGLQATSATPVWLRAGTLILLIGSSLAAGLMMARLTERYASAARQRDQHFHAVLRLAADWYWELDERFRFRAPGPDGRLPDDGPEPDAMAGRPLWEIAGPDLDDEARDALRADLESHRPFKDLLLPWRDGQGRSRHLRVSGEPRFDARGVFRGYWGVGVDAGPEIGARRAIAASEMRVRELFERTPSPLVLHRDDIVLDANPAAVDLLGLDRLDDLVDRRMTDLFEPGLQLDLVRQRIHQLEQSPVGASLPEEAFVLRSPDGPRNVQMSAVRIDAIDGPASLSIFFDETEQVLADAALRRSEGLLAHLVRSSPDSITVSEIETGRYVMVNPAFERLYGYAAGEVIGRTSIEIGSWADPADRERVVAQVRSRGRIDAMPARFLGKYGGEMLMMVSGAAFEIDGMQYLVLVSRDMTAIERTRLEHQAMLQHASIGIAFVRARSFQLANTRFEEMFGWGPGALTGRPTALVWPGQEAYDEMERIALPLLLAGSTLDVEQQMRRRDGSVFWCRLRAQAIGDGYPSRGGTIWIAEDVTERRQTEQALAAARDAAEAANRAKSAFLANTSHEIRTPLNGLLSLARLALEAPRDDARRETYLHQILDCAHTLAGTIADILDLSKIEAGKLVVESAPFDLQALLDSLHSSHLELAASRGLELRLEVAPDVPRLVQGDALRTRQILANYVSNALKFTEEGGIELSVAGVGGDVLRFSVSDTGSGIDDATLARLFRPFTQADDSTTRRYGGTGLGLSICRELATLLGGRVGVYSRVGEGSSFWVELPLPPADALPRPDAAPAERPSLAGVRVLMVEDNPVNMLVAVATLEQWGVRVEQASDGPGAIEAVHRADAEGRPFDVVLMDVQMPRMSGHQATIELRRTHDAQQLPIVALTAAALVSERDLALKAGMNEFLTKPIDCERLRETIARIVEPRRAASGD